ncbi:MAG: putative toxin-antitoxin system toxin component, PIN family [Verrucomicrobiales bacterium]|nr:putative toxin-antitoxin system toxin component, PIN family [Verrucomicrobiales bacterium]
MLAVVFDTNILFSATGWRGKPFECVEQAREGKIQAVTCVELMKELAEKLESKLGFAAEQNAETLADYLSFLRVVSIPKTLNAVPRDPDDNAVLECALEGNAKFVVSGANDLLELKNFRGIEIVRASEFLEVLQKQKS